MNNKLKIICIVIISLIVLGIVFGIVDVNRAKDNMKPIFSIHIGTYMDGGTAEYYGLGYKIIIYNKNGSIYEENYHAVKVGTWFMRYEDGLESSSGAINIGAINEVRFIRTYEVLNDLNISDDTGNYNYYTIKQYQNEEPVVVKIKNIYKLEEKQNYEFTFIGNVLAGSYQYYNIDEIFDEFTIIDIQKTEKEGTEQEQQDIYNSNVQMTNPYNNNI